MQPLHLLWFGIVGVLLAGYGVLDGFDLGVGILHLFVRKDDERRTFLNAIGPIWDGNEVWLVVFGGAVFAASPARLRRRLFRPVHAVHARPVRPHLPGRVHRGAQQAADAVVAQRLGHGLLRGQRAGQLPLRRRRR
jgi:hypothetical protein